MKIFCFLLIFCSSVFAQFDTIRWGHQRDSAWNAISCYPDALEWDSSYMVRWTFWTCSAIHKREDSSRFRDHEYYLERYADDDKLYDSVVYRNARSKAFNAMSNKIMANLDVPSIWIYQLDSLTRVRWDDRHTCEWICGTQHRHWIDSVLTEVRDEAFKEEMNARYDGQQDNDDDEDYSEPIPITQNEFLKY